MTSAKAARHRTAELIARRLVGEFVLDGRSTMFIVFIASRSPDLPIPDFLGDCFCTSTQAVTK